MPHLASEGARTVANAIANGFVAPYHLDDRNLRVAIGCKSADDVYGTIFGTIRAANTRIRREPVLTHRL